MFKLSMKPKTKQAFLRVNNVLKSRPYDNLYFLLLIPTAAAENIGI